MCEPLEYSLPALEREASLLLQLLRGQVRLSRLGHLPEGTPAFPFLWASWKHTITGISVEEQAVVTVLNDVIRIIRLQQQANVTVLILLLLFIESIKHHMLMLFTFIG